MISILHRYVFRELVRSFLLAFFALMIIMVLGGIYKPLRMGLSLGQLLRFLPYALPYSLPWVIPASLLTACLMTYGRLAADNELMAIAASGLPVRYMCYPTFLVGLALAVASLPLNSRLIPYSRAMQKRVVAEALSERPFAIAMLGGEETIEIGDFRLFVASIEDNVLRKVLVLAPMEQEGGERGRPAANRSAQRVQVYRADEARYSIDREDNVIRIQFRDARYTIVTPNESASGWLDLKADEQTIKIPFEEGGGHVRSSRSELYSHELRQQAAEATKTLAVPEATEHDIERAKERWADLMAEVHRREALAFSCFVVCLLGMPLGMFIRRESKLAAFSIAVLVFLVLYALLVGGEALAVQRRLPPRLALWGPDAVMGLLGVGLLLHAFRR
jgi:lipopolysaccharide export LptBFGC system permease protein LptF